MNRRSLNFIKQHPRTSASTRRCVALAFALTGILAASGLAAQGPQDLTSSQPQMKPFVVQPRAAWQTTSPVDVSFLLDAPAGKHGFVIVKDGHLATADDGRRIRFWGVNITDWSPGSRQIPSKADAPMIAATLARFGINAVRFQFLDLDAPRGLITPGPTTQNLDPAQFDREDYFIAQLEKRGIYIDFNLLVGRPFKPGDDVKDASLLHEGAKGTSLFDARLIALQKDYARALLDHLNPYTGRKYTDDPAVAIVEINNEDAIDVGFHAPSPFYEQELTGLYNTWLTAHRTPAQNAALRQLSGVSANAPVPLIGFRGAASAAPARFLTEAAFYNDLERNYFEDMERFLKQTLGLHALVMATADHNHAASGYPMLLATQSMDIIDGHTYWEHPEYYATKSPMVNDPFDSMPVELSRTAIAGKPYTVSEVNEPFPNDYAGEGIPILAAYAAFQDWDGVFWYTFEPKKDPTWKPYVGDPFDLSLDPVKMPELAAGALAFLRGDIAPAHDISTRSYSEQQVFDSMLLPAGDRPFFTPGFPLALPLTHEVRISSLDGAPTAAFPPIASTSPITSDTGELRWYFDRPAPGEGLTGPYGRTTMQDGLVTVDSPRTEALIGFARPSGFAVSHMSAQVENGFCTLLLTSLDGKPLTASAKMLLVAGGPVRNTGETWNTAGTDVTSWGQSPTLIDVVRGTLTLRGLNAASGVTLQPIDGAGHPLGSPVSAHRQGHDWRLPLGASTTTWYLVTVVR